MRDHSFLLFSSYPCSDLFKVPALLKPGGIHNYLYQLKPSSDETSQVKIGGSNNLGKLQITWRSNLGEPGRLQTQQILGSVSTMVDSFHET